MTLRAKDPITESTADNDNGITRVPAVVSLAVLALLVYLASRGSA